MLKVKKKEREVGENLEQFVEFVNYINFFDSEIYCFIFYLMNFWVIKI